LCHLSDSFSIVINYFVIYAFNQALSAITAGNVSPQGDYLGSTITEAEIRLVENMGSADREALR